MAERRAIKSRIWDDEFFGELSFFEGLLWIGLFSRLADDQGRLVDNPALISSQVFPYKSVPAADIEMALQSFGEHIIRYEVNGKRYIQLPKWWDNQPLQYAVPSNYPAPDGWTDHYRTTYKGKYVVFNWDGKDTPDTEIGVLLFNKLKTLARISSWTDYVGALNPNPNPNLNTNHIGSNNKKVEESQKETPPPPNYNPPCREELVYRAVTNHPTIPPGSADDVIAVIASIQMAKQLDNNGMVEYLRPFWQTFKKRYANSAKAFWLTEWAVTGVIPDKAANKQTAKEYNYINADGLPCDEMGNIKP